MSGQRGKFLQKRLRFLQRWLIRLCRSFMALLMVPLLLLQKKGKKKKLSANNSFASRQYHFSLRLFKNQRRAANSGFVLPTIAILLLIMSLVVASLLFRSTNRTTQVMGQREQQIVYNSATPAIDRAKAKLEKLFESAPQVPTDLYLADELLKDTIYTLPDETRLDINGDGTKDNAWSFSLDTIGDNKPETVAYSILHQVSATNNKGELIADRTVDDLIKAKNLIVRNGPVETQKLTSSACQAINKNAKSEEGWENVSTSNKARAFQVTALVVDDDNTNTSQLNRTVVTLEMQQDRQRSTGNKWGVWFRNDLEIFPGPQFNWNGVIHTEGNLMIGPDNKFRAFLISSPFSCIYARSNSEATISGDPDERIIRDDNSPIFMGQMIAGRMNTNSFVGSSQFDIFGVNGPTSTVTIDSKNDSVKDGSANPATLSLDPVVLFTENRNQTRDGDVYNKDTRDAKWKTSNLVTSDRIYNKSVKTPHADDTYRADNRYGPKPNYTDPFPPTEEYSTLPFPSKKKDDPADKKNGDPIKSDDYNPKKASIFSKITLLDSDRSKTNEYNNLGLDGYWERRAWAEGLRIITGQRLELGNANGWEGVNDPLYPPPDDAAKGSQMATRAHEQRQWRTLRDNLAAVQATAVYHSAGTNRNFPIACVATTAHPGTLGTGGTIENSTTFKTITIGDPTKPDATRLNTNFLTGTGTNGWEFNPPTANGTILTDTTFGDAIASDKPLGKALRNLASFAGEIDGAFPPKQEVVGSKIVHPYPNFTMWGNFSNLRRALKTFDDGTKYNDLSIADKTTIQTAACTLGMIAYNQDTESWQATQYIKENLSGIVSLGEHLWQLVDGNIANGEVNNLISLKVPFPIGYNRETDADNFYSQFTTDDFIQALNNELSLNNSKKTEYIATLKEMVSREQKRIQVERDRALGFRSGTTRNLNPDNTMGWNPSTGEIIISEGKKKSVTLKTLCDPFNFKELFKSNPSAGGTDEKAVGLALGACSDKSIKDMKPKYPALYYLFPLFNHDHDGNNDSATPRILIDHRQPNEDVNGNSKLDSGEDLNSNGILDTPEPYIADKYIFDKTDSNPSDDINDVSTYKVIGDDDNNGIEEGTENSLSAIAIQPKLNLSAWVLPRANPFNASNNVNQIDYNGTKIGVSFLDKGIFNGREMMSVRVLDVDLNLLRSNPVPGSTETWLPYSGVVYAFREDAVREDGIARPASAAWSSCDTANKISGTTCLMNAVGTSPKDPPVNGLNADGTFAADATGVSPKSVDFYPDPDRRPYGFRLRKGRDLRRLPSPPEDERNLHLKGITFVSDNPVYIQADDRGFNLHGTGTTPNPDSPIEEFEEALNSTWTNFYTRKKLNTKVFATKDDSWRATDVIADGITVLSSNFVDGSIAEGILRTNVSDRSSYRTLNAPNNANQQWVREDGTQSNSVTYASPIKISRDNFPLYGANRRYGKDDTNGYITFGDGTNRTPINVSNSARVNAIIASGLVPSRAQQSYGGLHNFPRFLESWGSNSLNIAGAFYQLNFSSYATGSFDQDSWEPGNNAQSGEVIPYYGPPERRWGYDVGLQYVPPSSFADRMRDKDKPRSEFYRELSIDDPYVLNLRCAKRKVGGVDQRIDVQIDPLKCPA